ncbi:MAG: hypothetical protein LBK71_03345 [Verrucomicrobiales bacterium]|nr:hypothetical protein [Verrucomicrobiales bacterium]
MLAAAVSISGDDVFLTRADRDAIRARYDALERVPAAVVIARRAKCLHCQWSRRVIGH